MSPEEKKEVNNRLWAGIKQTAKLVVIFLSVAVAAEVFFVALSGPISRALIPTYLQTAPLLGGALALVISSNLAKMTSTAVFVLLVTQQRPHSGASDLFYACLGLFLAVSPLHSTVRVIRWEQGLQAILAATTPIPQATGPWEIETSDGTIKTTVFSWQNRTFAMDNKTAEEKGWIPKAESPKIPLAAEIP